MMTSHLARTDDTGDTRSCVANGEKTVQDVRSVYTGVQCSESVVAAHTGDGRQPCVYLAWRRKNRR